MTDLSTNHCPHCGETIPGDEEAVRSHRQDCYLALSRRENAAALERREINRVVDEILNPKDQATSATRHEVGQSYVHVGDRQTANLWAEVQRLTKENDWFRLAIAELERRLADVQASNDHWASKFASLSGLLEGCGFVVNVDHQYLSRNGVRYCPEEL